MPNTVYSNLTKEFTLNDLLKALGTLTEKIQVLRSKLSLPDDDARQLALFGIQEVLCGFGLTVHAITGSGLQSSQRTREEVIESFQNWVKIEKKNDQQLLEIVEKSWRLSIITLCHFKIDSLFQNLLKALNQKPKPSFGLNKKSLMKEITLPNPEEANKVLDALSSIRNSLHNNGIHNFEDRTHSFCGITYEFKKGKDIQCASFGHILNILDCSIDVIEQILFTQKIIDLHKVVDLYVQLNP